MLKQKERRKAIKSVSISIFKCFCPNFCFQKSWFTVAQSTYIRATDILTTSLSIAMCLSYTTSPAKSVPAMHRFVCEQNPRLKVTAQVQNISDMSK